MKSIILLAATFACVCAQVSMPPGYKEKYPYAYKYSKIARHPRDLTPKHKHTEDSGHLSGENHKQLHATTNEIAVDKNLKANKDTLQHPKELTSDQVDIKVSSPNIATDHPKLGMEVTTENNVVQATESDMNMVNIKPTADTKMNEDDVTDYILVADVLISEDDS